jgi:hypothetical protein
MPGRNWNKIQTKRVYWPALISSRSEWVAIPGPVGSRADGIFAGARRGIAICHECTHRQLAKFIELIE